MMKKIFLILILMVSIVSAGEVTLGTLGNIVVDRIGHITDFTASDSTTPQKYEDLSLEQKNQIEAAVRTKLIEDKRIPIPPNSRMDSNGMFILPGNGRVSVNGNLYLGKDW